jgi:NitT/TauT family transport system substrate-binding protein
MFNALTRRAAATVAGTLLSTTLAAFATLTSPAANAGTLTIAHTTWVGYGTLYLARDLGYFKQEGLDVDLKTIDDASIYMAAQASGKIDGSASTVDEVMKFRSPNFCFKSVIALDESFGGDGVLVSDGVNSFADLKKQPIAMSEGSVSQFWLAYLLKQRGMSIKDMTIENMSADDAASAFIAKRVPAAVTWEPHLTFVREHKQGKVLIDSSATPGVIVDVVTLNCDIIKNCPKDVQALVDGIYKAVAYTKANPEKAYAIMAKGVGGYLADPKAFAEAAKGVRFYDQPMNVGLLGTSAKPGSVEKVITLGSSIWSDLGKQKVAVDYSMLVDPTFASAKVPQ